MILREGIEYFEDASRSNDPQNKVFAGMLRVILNARGGVDIPSVAPTQADSEQPVCVSDAVLAVPQEESIRVLSTNGTKPIEFNPNTLEGEVYGTLFRQELIDVAQPFLGMSQRALRDEGYARKRLRRGFGVAASSHIMKVERGEGTSAFICTNEIKYHKDEPFTPLQLTVEVGCRFQPERRSSIAIEFEDNRPRRLGYRSTTNGPIGRDATLGPTCLDNRSHVISEVMYANAMFVGVFGGYNDSVFDFSDPMTALRTHVDRRGKDTYHYAFNPATRTFECRAGGANGQRSRSHDVPAENAKTALINFLNIIPTDTIGTTPSINP